MEDVSDFRPLSWIGGRNVFREGISGQKPLEMRRTPKKIGSKCVLDKFLNSKN